MLLWLQGGPGGTSLFGLFNEHGPYIVQSDNTLKARPATWALTHNIIYIDNPVGTGSFFNFLVVLDLSSFRVIKRVFNFS